jgi:hypothetical protein
MPGVLFGELSSAVFSIKAPNTPTGVFWVNFTLYWAFNWSAYVEPHTEPSIIPTSRVELSVNL